MNFAVLSRDIQSFSRMFLYGNVAGKKVKKHNASRLRAAFSSERIINT